MHVLHISSHVSLGVLKKEKAAGVKRQVDDDHILQNGIAAARQPALAHVGSATTAQQHGRSVVATDGSTAAPPRC